MFQRISNKFMNFNKAVKIGLIIIFGIMLPTLEQEEKVKIAACLMGVIG